MNTTAGPADLGQDLRAAGVPVSDLWELVNSKGAQRQAVPVLLDWLRRLDDRVEDPAERAKTREGLVRALSVPAARPMAAPALIREFRNTEDPSGLGLGWVIGNALSVVADDSVFDDIESLLRDRSYGKARQMIVFALSRSTDPRAVALLVDLLADDDVVAHAVITLGKLRPKGVRAAIEPLREHPAALVRREARKALARLPV